MVEAVVIGIVVIAVIFGFIAFLFWALDGAPVLIRVTAQIFVLIAGIAVLLFCAWLIGSAILGSY